MLSMYIWTATTIVHEPIIDLQHGQARVLADVSLFLPDQGALRVSPLRTLVSAGRLGTDWLHSTPSQSFECSNGTRCVV